MSVHSKDSNKPRKTKLERLSELAYSNPDTVFNNLGHILDAELLTEMHRQSKGNKAVGIDKVTKTDYEKKFTDNIQNLLRRIRKGTYHPKAARITEIPKEDGSRRPLAISCYEDKLVQMAVSKILTAIYEPTFLPCSYGFRPKRGCHDALRALRNHAYDCYHGAVVEIDIRKYFNSIPHEELTLILEKKIADHRFLKLIDALATAPIVEQGKPVNNVRGCPQGSIISPILANIYLHEVIDKWFETTKHNHHFKGKAELVRYADDMVFIFENYMDAKRFYNVLPKRLAKYGLEMHEDKSRLIRSGQNCAKYAHGKGERLPTYKFLGFTVYWGKARNGKWWRMKYKSRSDRLRVKLQGLKRYLRENRNDKGVKKTLTAVVWVVQGWLNYHAISDNQRSVSSFLRAVRYIIYQWLNRRGGRKLVSWQKVYQILDSVRFPWRWPTISIFS